MSSLSRRDVAALRLAYECLRGGDHGGDAVEALVCGDLGSEAIAADLDRCDPPWRSRLVRARLALYIRARLRAESGDCGAYWCPGCRQPVRQRNGDEPDHGYCNATQRTEWFSRRITPLWEQAGKGLHDGR